MDGWIVCRDGVDVAAYFAGNDSQYPGTRFVVYFGGGIGVHNRGDILSVATDEVFTCGLALVRDWWDSVFLFRRIVWVYFGQIKNWHLPVFYNVQSAMRKKQIPCHCEGVLTTAAIQ